MLLIHCLDVYLCLNGSIIPNHGYVVISNIGSEDNISATPLICNTNRPPPNGIFQSEGDWISPTDVTVGYLNKDNVTGFERDRDPMVVRLWRNPDSDGNPVEGIYHCVINDTYEMLQTVYVGLYYDGEGKCSSNGDIYYSVYFIGNITVSGNMTLTENSDLNGPNPQFNLTCISTGGPATTVIWTRGNATITKGHETVLNDPVTAQYTHTLTVTGRLGGLYTCTVANNKPSMSSETLDVQCKYLFM